ncbi:lariat debranching enzyme, C-terminal domain-containing protein [Amylostereum chailletii]|nr:lariat debranching enzyme, C-terminal domain-containing protein [Amylostereum chailletii]
MKIAVEGCCHGELPAIYRRIAQLETQNNYKVDLLLVCGDFQAIRNRRDLECMAVPPKYRQLGEFYKYYTGEVVAPVPTIVIGGNHEASNYLWELYHGGWLAPNIYYLGQAGSILVNGIKISGASGIFKPGDFRIGRLEKLPYDKSSIRSVYHVREFDVRRLSLLSSPHIFLSHDWPQGIEHHGDLNGLLRRKPFFRADVQTGSLGSPPMMELLRNLRPQWWFAAHLHVRFEATVLHEPGTGAPVEPAPPPSPVQNPEEITIDDDEFDTPALPTPVETPAEHVQPAEVLRSNPDEILLDDEEEDVAPPPPPPSKTRFLALDKCLPSRQFLEVVDVPTPPDFADSTETVLYFDPEWLAISRAFHPLLSTKRVQPQFPDPKDAWNMVNKEFDWVTTHVGKHFTPTEDGVGDAPASTRWRIDEVQKFAMTAPGPESQNGGDASSQPPFYPNPQTEAFAALLGVENKIK